MKNYSFQIMVCFAALSIGLIHGCKKNSDMPGGTPPVPVISTSFTEEFKNVYSLTHAAAGNWVTKGFPNDNLNLWEQGQYGTDKGGNHYGFPAYSYSDSMDEYAFSPVYGSSVSSWLITPVLSVKNGDKISFFTCASYWNLGAHMQVLMNKSVSTDVGDQWDSVGSFTTVLFDIPDNGQDYAYPTTWTKYEYTFSGISGKIETRIAFRHYVTSPSNGGADVGVGIDMFSFVVK